MASRDLEPDEDDQETLPDEFHGSIASAKKVYNLAREDLDYLEGAGAQLELSDFKSIITQNRDLKQLAEEMGVHQKTVRHTEAFLARVRVCAKIVEGVDAIARRNVEVIRKRIEELVANVPVEQLLSPVEKQVCLELDVIEVDSVYKYHRYRYLTNLAYRVRGRKELVALLDSRAAHENARIKRELHQHIMDNQSTFTTEMNHLWFNGDNQQRAALEKEYMSWRAARDVPS